jgi:hypothetical protein
VAADDALDGGQPYPRPFELVRSVKALEGAEELARVGLIEAHPVVAHVIHRGPVVLDGSELDLCVRLFAGELPGVA